MPPFGLGHGHHHGHHGRGGMGGFGGFGGFGYEGFLQDLDLTDAQVEKIAELKADSMGEGMEAMLQGKRYFKQLMQELAQENIDKDKVKAAHKALQEHKAKTGEMLLERALAFAETLTGEQRKKLKRSAMRRFLNLDGDDRHGSGFGFGPGGAGGFDRGER